MVHYRKKIAFDRRTQKPWNFSYRFDNIKNNIFSWTGPPGARTESGETRTAGQQPRPPIPQASPLHVAAQSEIPHFVCATSWSSSSKSCRLLARSASALLLQCLLLQRT